MSLRAITWALEQTTGSSSAKLILVKLADNANDEGYCFPSIALTVRQTELSERSVRNYIQELEKRGFIEIIRRFKDGVQLPNHYRLNLQFGVGVVQILQDRPAEVAEGVVQILQTEPLEDNPQREPRLPHPKKSLKRSIPDNFPKEQDLEWAKNHWLAKGRADLCDSIGDEAAKFRDYHTANPKGSADWSASWRTWAKNAMNWAKVHKNNMNTSPPPVVKVDFDSAGWHAALSRFLLDGFWLSDKSGPDPCGENCQAPATMLTRAREVWKAQGNHPLKNHDGDPWTKHSLYWHVPKPFWPGNVVQLRLGDGRV